MNKNEFYEALNRNREYALEHWGIKGQKWGLRRFQNPDGTLTEEGKRHYGRMGELPKGHSRLKSGKRLLLQDIYKFFPPYYQNLFLALG